MKKLVSLIGLFFVFNLPFACNPCGPFDNRPYKIVSMSSIIGSVQDFEFSDEALTQFELASIKIQINDVEQVGLNVQTRFNLLSSAYACSPPPPNVQVLETVNITSSENIMSNGTEFLAGVNLNSLFKVIYARQEFTIDEFIDEHSRNSWDFGLTNGFVLFQLVAKPDVKIDQKFTFNFTFDDGLEYQVLTPVFTVE